MKKEIEKLKDKEGKLPNFAEPGGYPIIYVDEESCVLCADCASKENAYSTEVIAYDILWEGWPVHCEDCNKEIESAYGPEEEK